MRPAGSPIVAGPGARRRLRPTAPGVRRALAGAASLLLVAGCGADRQGDRVTVLGDSITALGQGGIEADLGSQYSLNVDGVFGAKVADRMFAAAGAAAGDPDQVVINLGTNDVLHGTPIAEAAAPLNDMVGLFGAADCVHVVTINTNMTQDGESMRGRAEELNRAIETLPDSHANVDVVHWDEIQQDAAGDSDPGALTRDGIHPDDDGLRRLTEAYGDALGSCGSPWSF